jgi:alkanesulfonate monooxygenase
MTDMPNVYTVTPESYDADGRIRPDFAQLVAETAHATEHAGWTGMLVPHNFHEVDPWVVAGHLGSVSARLIPLLALQPATMPPHTAAACAAAFAALYGRPMYFNLVAGARGDELARVGDALPHDRRYERVEEYARVLRALLEGERVSSDGGHYRYDRHRLEPRGDALADCRIFLAGSSPAGIEAATQVADVAVTHPAPLADWRAEHLARLRDAGFAGEVGIRIGVVCRPERADAWQIARDRFPASWQGRQETLLKTRSENAWARELAQLATAEPDGDETHETFWLGAFASGMASAPFLVGSYEDVATALGGYLDAGVGHVLLNGAETADYAHIANAIALAARQEG